MIERNTRTIVENRKAFHDFFIEERYQAGIVLTGTEIKSIRMREVNLRDSVARIENQEVFLYNMHISPYTHGNRFNHEPTRTRKLLLNKKEIIKLIGKTKEKGYSLIPLRLYFSGDWVKVELGLARGKKQFDKRESIKEKDIKRRIDRAIRKFT